MKKSSVPPSFFILLTVASCFSSTPITARASSGVVCLADPSSTSCPSSNALFSGNVGGQLRIAVLVQGSDLINGFDITTIVDNSILKSVGVDLTGSILTSPSPPTLLSECINGIGPFNAVCASHIPFVLGTIEFSVGACPGCLASSTTGLLFTEIYNITGTAPEIPVAFLTGCKQTSVSNTCIDLSNGTRTPVPETSQAGSFGNSSSPDFVITASPNILTVPEGTSRTLTISIASVSGFAGQVELSIPEFQGPEWILSPTNITLAAGQTINSTLTVFAFSGLEHINYVNGVTGTDGLVTHSLGVGVTVVFGPDFSIAPNSFAVPIPVGGSATFALTLTSVRGFNGTIRLFISPRRSGLTFSPVSTNVTLTSSANVTETVLVLAPTTAEPGFYLVDVEGSAISGNASVLPQFTSLDIIVEGFSISTAAPEITMSRGTQTKSNLTLESLGGFAGTVDLSFVVSSGKHRTPTVLFANSTITLSPDTSSLVQLVIIVNKNVRAGTYLVSVTGSSGPIVVSSRLVIIVTS